MPKGAKRGAGATLFGGAAGGPVRILLVAWFICLSNIRADAICVFGMGNCLRTFKDCGNCPEMIEVPAGSFMMGSAEGERGSSSEERPRHRVTIAQPFAVSEFPITFDEWDLCVAKGDCAGGSAGEREDYALRISDNGWGRGRRPVINVMWTDAQRYVAWISKITGKSYRLLTEAEYEYAARAGTQTVYPWGNDIGTNNANCDGCGSQWDEKQTSPVGSFAANGFGLYDMVGNVYSWVEDCVHHSYDGAPTDGAAWIAGGDCGTRIIRGGSPVFSASRNRMEMGHRYFKVGFRVGRTIATSSEPPKAPTTIFRGATITCEGTAITAGQVLAYDRSQNKPGGFALVVNKGTGPEGVCHSIAATARLTQLKTEGEGASIRVYGADVDVLVQGLTGVKVTVTKF